MAATLCVKFLPKQGWTPLTQSVRHGSKAVTRHRKPQHILKQKLIAVTRYIPPPKAAPQDAYPRESTRQLESPLTSILKRDMSRLFEDCKMVAVVQNNNSKSEDMTLFKHRLHKHGIAVKFYPNQVKRLFAQDSAYSNMAPLFSGPTVLLVSEEPRVKEMLKALRSSPQMTLLGACIENTLLSSQGVVRFSELPSAAVVQGELVGGLTAMTARTASVLGRHPARLSALLQRYVEQRGAEERES